MTEPVKSPATLNCSVPDSDAPPPPVIMNSLSMPTGTAPLASGQKFTSLTLCTEALNVCAAPLIVPPTLSDRDMSIFANE